MTSRLTFSGALILGVAFVGAGEAQQAKSVYRTPNSALVSIVDAAPTPGVSLGPNHEWMLLLESPSLPSIAELAERELRLAGMRIKPQINGRSRTRPYDGLTLLRMSDRAERAITGLPESPRIENVRWSPNGKWVSFTNTTDDGIALWVAEVRTAEARRLTGPVVNMTMASAPAWLSDNQTLIAAVVPEGRGPEPQASRVPTGPTIQENIDKTAPARTYQDLLSNENDERLWEYYATSQLVRIDLDGGIAPLGKPSLVSSFSSSPDGNYVLVQTLHRPFSYLVPAYRFPRRIEVLDLAGSSVHVVAELPLQEGVPMAFGSVPTGPRSVRWRGDAAATLVWAEALDGGDGRRQAEERDEIFMLDAPFDGTPQSLITLGLRYGGIRWGTDDVAMVYSSWRRTRQVRAWLVKPGDGGAEPELLFDRSSEDRYGDPGAPDTRRNAMGRSVIITGDGGRTV